MDKKTIPKIGAVLAAAGIWVAVTANGAMVPYGGSTPLEAAANDPTTVGVVGTIGGTTGQGQGGWDTFQQTAAQALLNLAQGGSGTVLGEAIYANTVYDYFGTVDTVGPSLPGGLADTTVPAGWNFAIAKYDGQNAGYVVFYLGGASVTLPSAPADFWTTNPNKWELSNWTAFNAVPEPTTVVAGALLLLPFGVSTLRALRNRRAQI